MEGEIEGRGRRNTEVGGRTKEEGCGREEEGSGRWEESGMRVIIIGYKINI